TFLKIMADQDRIVVEAWIKFAVVPGVYAGEMGIDGVFGAVPKSMLSGRVRNVELMITNNGGVATGATAPAPGAAPQPQQPPVQPQQPPQYAPPPVQPQPPVQPRPAPIESQPAPIEPQQVPVEPQPQQKREHIFCTSCGNKMPISASFCTSCGNKLK
ncbi:MAG: zinc ribbon domain-containing protein, partial [Clostridia bacterium]|nr:zinc ribbon domain-containing protein [Clostridia bacterium]